MEETRQGVGETEADPGGGGGGGQKGQLPAPPLLFKAL